MRKFLFYVLLLSLLIACKSNPPALSEISEIVQIIEIEEAVIEVVEEEPVIQVLEPEFNVVSIAIIQADLINTKFEAVIRIDNPNEFAVSLSSLYYELYGNGRLWAEGRENNILQIPARSSCETEFYFTMNFIDMNRNLLDDIIAMRRVQYNFRGDAEVQPVINHLPPFYMSFNCSGLSEVKRKTN
jgi:LEA14-like dessication related protein